MRTVALLTTAAVLLCVSWGYLGLSVDSPLFAQAQPGKVVPLPPPPPDDPADAKPPTDKEASEKSAPSKAPKVGNPDSKGEKPARKMDKRTLTGAQQADEKAIRQLAESLAKAYQEGNARAVAAHFTEDAEYVDEDGHVCQGQEEIEECLTEFFAEHPACKLEFKVESIRFVADSIAVEDGTSRIVHTEGDGPVDCRYTAVHVKQLDGKWLTASVRDQRSPKQLHRQHATQLKQLDWLLGDWIDEGDSSTVMFACEAVDAGNFLLRKFTVRIGGQDSISGTQRIGWDPVSSRFRVWLFDSEGGYGDGSLRRDGDRWILRMSGITADGQSVSATSIYTLVNDHTMTWQNVDHEVGGEQLPDSEEVTIVRQAPKPKIADLIAE